MCTIDHSHSDPSNEHGRVKATKGRLHQDYVLSALSRDLSSYSMS